MISLRILAIETSCDETGIAIIDGSAEYGSIQFSILSAVLFSQAHLHAEFGGVYPTLAKREHEKNLPILLTEVLAKARLSDGSSIDAVTVTQGPGLEPALWTGIEFAKRLAHAWEKPLFGANHMEGHLISSLVENGVIENITFPVLALLISGGHTEFISMDRWFSYTVVGETLDDAVGEAFDKMARMLGLPYPGGPHIARLAHEARQKDLRSEVSLPRPMLNQQSCDMSFSGLKTAALYALRDRGGVETLTDEEKMSFAREFEDAVADVFIAKTQRALIHTGAQSFVIGGGVAANEHIRTSLVEFLHTEFPDVSVRLPELSITGDNAIMIGDAALVHLLLGDWSLESPPSGEIRAEGNLSIASGK